MKKTIFNIAVIVLAFVSVFSFALKAQGFDNIRMLIANMNYWWILLAILCMCGYWLMESLSLYSVTACIYEKPRYIDSLQVSMIGQFFNSITPFASGGQPIQMYYMNKKGINVGTAGSILMVKFLIYQFTMNMYVFLILVFKFGEFAKYQTGLLALALCGFALNMFVIVVLILFSFKRSWTEKILDFCLAVLKFLRLGKNPEETKAKTLAELELFHDNFNILKKNAKKMIKVSLYVVIQLTCLFIIPYLVYRAFNFNQESLASLFIITVFLVTAMSFIPLPGASFGAEGGFITFFGPAFGSTVVFATFVWRTITYYSCIFVGSLFFIKCKGSGDMKLKEALEMDEETE